MEQTKCYDRDMRSTKGNATDTPLRRLHDSTERDLSQVSMAMGLKSVEHYHVILLRGTEKYHQITTLADALGLPFDRVAEAARVTRQNYQKNKQTKSLEMACA